MKIINKIKVFFNFKGEKQEVKVSAAEVKTNGVFLHPEDDPKHTFFIKATSVDIIINENKELSEGEISIIDKETDSNNITSEEKEPVLIGAEQHLSPLPEGQQVMSESYSPNKKRRFSVMLYQDEYDELLSNISAHGYKRAEFFLACVNSAKKQSFNTIYKKYTSEHLKRYKVEREEAAQKKEVSLQAQ